MKDAITSDSSTVERDGDDPLASRGEDLSSKRGMQAKLGKIYDTVVQGFIDKKERNEATQRFWRIFNCELTTNQAYNGNSQIYLPIVRDAIEARVQKFTNTLFPQSGRYVDMTTLPADFPRGILGLLDHYVKRSDLRSKTRTLLRNGEVEGQFSFYVYWNETTRYITKKIEMHPEVDDGVFDPDDTFFDVEDDEVKTAFPDIEVLLDNDLAVLPATTESIEYERGVIVAVKRYYSEEGLKAAKRDKLFTNPDAVAQAVKQCKDYDPANTRNTAIDNSESAGVRVKANKKEYIVYEVWKKEKIKGKLRWCQMFFGGEALCLGMTVNPYWNDRCPVISRARNKAAGSFWGKSPVDAVEQLQYMANDWMNMAQDSGQYSLLPIVMTDPEKNPNYASMILSLAAVWQTNPNDTKFVEFPQLWKDAIQFVAEARSQIVQAFGLNPSMISMGFLARQQTQAAIAQESLVAIANITDEVMTLEDALFNPLLQFYFELDQQFRDVDLAVKVYGQPGISAQMEKVPPFAWDDRYEFTWRGSQVANSQQQNQQMISGLNILGRMGPMLSDGKKIDLAPIIETVVENIYGPRLGARILIDQRAQMTVEPELENELMAGNLSCEVHQTDDDPKHMQVHAMAIQKTGDVNGQLKIHIQKHQAQMVAKQQQQMQQMQGPQGGGPKPGAQPGVPRGGQQPPGAVHKDEMQDPSQMPRQAEGTTMM